ncbi:hypothetical protein [Deinococcus pimensis]|uniref:hypothetical protein n=1 Tax=Deinococcus pimensis TaxID=309888 RepID=UPI0004895A95|nr:hypothetical protein [Deinococcus pimensis]
MILVGAHRRVLGVSGDTEVLVCGHVVPRFEGTAAFAALVGRGEAAHPRLRACPLCPPDEVRLPASLSGVAAPPEVVAWWAGLAVRERAGFLDLLGVDEHAATLRGRTPRRALPEHDRTVLEGVLNRLDALARQHGLSVREWGSRSRSAPAALGGWALARAAARRYEAGERGRSDVRLGPD